MDEQTPRRRESDQPRGKLRKGMYILPSLFTTANIAMGYYAILQVTHATAAEPCTCSVAITEAYSQGIRFSRPR